MQASDKKGKILILMYFFFPPGVLKEPFVQKLLDPSFYEGLTKEMRDEWKKRTGKTLESSMEEFLIQNVGAPMNGLFRYC